MNLNALWQTQPIMLGFGWLTLKQAQDALRTGRLDEAHRLLTSPALANQRKACELLPALMRALVERGEKYLRLDDAAGAWGDLLKAEQLGMTDNAPVRLRQALTRLGLAEVKAQLEAGEPARAVETIAKLRKHAVRQPELDPLEQAAKDWLIANECAERGEFAQALQILERVRRAVSLPTHALERQQRSCQEQQERFAPLVLQLHQAAQRESWHEVLQFAQQLLALAPQHVEARRLRSQAWRAIEPPTQVSSPSARERSRPDEPPRQQLLLWIDGVGGFLLCLDSTVTLGQATQETLADIPLFADISRKHARLQRDSEGYLLEAQRPVQVNGVAQPKAVLRHGDTLTLGGTCQLRFTLPVPISATARLDLLSGHRLRLSVDGVVLMADSLILGPREPAHILLPDTKQQVILYRGKEGLAVRYAGTFVLNGQAVKDRAALSPPCSVQGNDFSFALEPVEHGRNERMKDEG